MVVLDLKQHCIKTSALRAHQRLVDRLISCSGPDPLAEEKLTIVQQFLEQSDFRELRAKHPELAGGSAIQITLWRSDSGQIRWSTPTPTCLS